MLLLLLLLLLFRGIQKGIITGLGLQKFMAVAMILSLWCLGLPLMRFLAFHENRGLLGVWQTMPICYVLLDIGLALTYALQNWTAISLKIQLRNKVSSPVVLEMDDVPLATLEGDDAVETETPPAQHEKEEDDDDDNGGGTTDRQKLLPSSTV